jgi:hypothetical protein
MAEMAGMAGMAERQKEWQNGRMAEVATYVLFMVHAANNDDNDDDTLIFHITDECLGIVVCVYPSCIPGNFIGGCGFVGKWPCVVRLLVFLFWNTICY